MPEGGRQARLSPRSWGVRIEKSVCSPPLPDELFLQPSHRGPAAMPGCFGKGGTWHQGPHHQKVPKPWAPAPASPATQVGNCSGRGSRPDRHCQPSPHGHQLYLPPRGRARLLSPAPSVPLDFSGASPSGHPLPSPWLPQVAARQGAAPWGRLMLPYAPPRTLRPHSRTQVPACLVSLCPRRTQGESETNPSVLNPKENVCSGAWLRRWALAQSSLSRLESRHFCFKIFILF